MSKKFLIDLFEILANQNVDYMVLRGYQELPENSGYDIDFSVINEKELTSFFNVLHELSEKYDYTISRDVVRLGLLKVFLHFGEEILRIDVFCHFYYAGLEYISSYDLHKTKRKLASGIWVPSLNYELAISLLKEMLHNSRIRKDKVDLLRSQYEAKTFEEPLAKYFSSDNIKDLHESLFSEGQLVFKKIASSFRNVLLSRNIKHKGALKTFLRIIYFFWIKYFGQKRYDYFILNYKE